MTSISITCVETRDPRGAIRAIESTAQCIKIDLLYWFSNYVYPNSLTGVKILNIRIPEFSDFFDNINQLYLRLMPKVVTTDFNLIVQPDGFATNPQAWDEGFLEYDYI